MRQSQLSTLPVIARFHASSFIFCTSMIAFFQLMAVTGFVSRCCGREETVQPRDGLRLQAW
ncbi:hypothetical protein KDA_31310 [Dictyobacter alpinus]|uniref:Uncharacterized protein n=1 Tax=Dictyobacter alpinus TaxID=2014873 RepID=A0A402B8K0_9CHLR|nr:hypothetical protein KDA_31310 [Dictyobacter alpinus]